MHMRLFTSKEESEFSVTIRVAIPVCCCWPGDILDSHQLISYLADISPLRGDVWLRRRLDPSVNNNSLHILGVVGLY